MPLSSEHIQTLLRINGQQGERNLNNPDIALIDKAAHHPQEAYINTATPLPGTTPNELARLARFALLARDGPELADTLYDCDPGHTQGSESGIVAFRAKCLDKHENK